MRISRWKIALVALGTVVALLVIPVAVASVIPTFTDVPASDWAFNDIEWLAAEGLTNGCEDGTKFCPDDPVSRREMAAFTHRLAEAVTPVVMTNIGPVTALSTDGFCEIGPYTAPYDQQATFSGGVYMRTIAAGGVMGAKVQTRMPPYAWVDVPGQFWIYDEGAASNQWVDSPVSGAIRLGAGHTYYFGVTAHGNDMGAGGCELNVVIHHAMPDSVIATATSAVSPTSKDDENSG